MPDRKQPRGPDSSSYQRPTARRPRGASSDPTTAVPLGLLIEEVPDRSRPGSDATRLRIRPVQPGTTRPWVKGSISWSELR